MFGKELPIGFGMNNDKDFTEKRIPAVNFSMSFIMCGLYADLRMSVRLNIETNRMPSSELDSNGIRVIYVVDYFYLLPFLPQIIFLPGLAVRQVGRFARSPIQIKTPPKNTKTPHLSKRKQEVFYIKPSFRSPFFKGLKQSVLRYCVIVSYY